VDIEGYKILHEISRGPVTTVYLAEQTALERQVLLKVLNVQWKNEHDLIERFRREAKISARLHHPNIVSIYDFGISGDYFYISMEYINGLTLAQFIRRHHPVPAVVALFIMREILTGLEYAHKRGVVHRDIKPSNILIQDDGMIKIADFGMATITDIPGLTEQGSAVGSPAYMSPEQALGKKLEANSDIFSLGVTVYEMLTAQSPFKGAHVAESIHKTLNENPPSLVTIRDDIPPWFSELIATMMEKEVRQRPQTCAVILRRLNTIKELPDQEMFAVYLRDSDTHIFVMPSEPVEGSRQAGQGKSFMRPILAVSAGLILLFILLFPWQRRAADNREGPILQPDNALKEIMSDDSSESAVVTGKQQPGTSVKNAGDTISKTEYLENAASSQNLSVKSRELTKEKNREIPAEFFVICTPWADIYINGKKKDTTPLNKAILLPAGRYDLQLKNPAYPVFQTDLILRSAQKETLRVSLQGSMGYLDLRVYPWARVFVDGTYRETTPLSAPIALREGRHIITLENPAFASVKDTVWIDAGKTEKKRLRFKK